MRSCEHSRPVSVGNSIQSIRWAARQVARLPRPRTILQVDAYAQTLDCRFHHHLLGDAAVPNHGFTADAPRPAWPIRIDG